MITNVAQTGGAQQSVADGVDEHVGIAMSKKPAGVGDLDAAKP